jgi:alpha-mannosidase
MEKLRTAESMAALVSIGDNKIFEVLKQYKEDFLYGISVYNLHGWTADGPIDRHDFASFMRKQQQKVTDYVDTLYNLSLNEMGRKINVDGLDNGIFIYNTLNWDRKGFVDIPIKKDYNCLSDPRTNKVINGHIISKDQSQYLRIFVDEIPSMGYKVYQLTNKNISSQEEIFQFKDDTLETPLYIVHISRSGAIDYLFDKKAKKNWVKGRINDIGSNNHESGSIKQIIKNAPGQITLLCRSDEPVKYESRITFYADNPRVDFQNTIMENYDELLHWTFNFNVEKPEVWHEEIGAVIKAKLASAGGHYADRMARYDYLTLNHFVNVGNEKESISISNADCLFFRLGNSTPDFLDMNSSSIHILVGGQVNKEQNLGIIKQDGDSIFHQSFSILPHHHKFDEGTSMRFALDHQNPLIGGNVLQGGEWKNNKHSFIRNNNKDVILWTLKPGEDEGSILRFWNMETNPVMSKINFSQNPQKAMTTTHIETDIIEIPIRNKTLSINLNQHQLKTYRVCLE